MALPHLAETAMDWVVTVLELLAAAIIVASAAWCLVSLARHRDVGVARRHVSEGLLLALDFTIGADVLKVALEPGWQGVAIVGGVVVVRIVLAAALVWEVEHERRREREAEA